MWDGGYIQAFNIVISAGYAKHGFQSGIKSINRFASDVDQF